MDVLHSGPHDLSTPTGWITLALLATLGGGGWGAYAVAVVRGKL